MNIDPFDSGALRANLRQRTVRGGKITLLAQAVLFAVQFGGSVLMARLLSPEDFGLIAMVLAVVGFLDTFKDLGLSVATIQQPNITREQVNVLFWFNAAAGAMMSLVTLCLAPALAWFYKRPELLHITIALSGGFLISSLAAQQKALLRRTMSFGRIARVDITSASIAMGVGLIAAWLGYGYWSIVFQQLTKASVSTAGLWIGAAWRPQWYSWDPSVKPMLRFGGFLAANSVMNYATRNVDNIAIGWMWGAGPLGLYSRAYSLMMLPLSQVSAPLAQVAIPALSRLRDEQDSFRRSFLSLMRSAGFLLIPPVAMLMACADSVVVLLLGEKWADVAVIYRWLGFAALAQPMTTTCGLLFQSQGRSKEMSQATMINSAVAVISILIALPWGAAAVAGSYAASGLLIRTPILFHYAAKVSSVTRQDMYSIVVPQLLMGGAIFGMSYLVLQRAAVDSHSYRICLAIAVGGFVVAAGLLLSSKQRGSLQEVLTLLKKKNNDRLGKITLS